MMAVFNGSRLFNGLRCLNRANFSSLPSEAVVFADRNIIVCWHPPQSFPYECTKPLPLEKIDSETVLKIGNKEVSKVFRQTKQSMLVQELAKLTFTTKHRWYPRSRDRKAKKIEMDRPYL